MSVLAVDAATFGSTTHPILQTVTVFLQTLSLDTMANSLGLLPDLFLFKMVPFNPILHCLQLQPSPQTFPLRKHSQ